jgi:hypothetical protein
MPKYAVAQIRPAFGEHPKVPFVRGKAISPATVEIRLRADMYIPMIDGHGKGLEAGDHGRPLILRNIDPSLRRANRMSRHQATGFICDSLYLCVIMRGVREGAIYTERYQDHDWDANTQTSAPSFLPLCPPLPTSPNLIAFGKALYPSPPWGEGRGLMVKWRRHPDGSQDPLALPLFRTASLAGMDPGSSPG